VTQAQTFTTSTD